MNLSYNSALRSRDKSTKVGCTIVKDGIVLTESYNGFPRGINDHVIERYERPLKYTFTEHAERNAINNCAREGLSTNGAIMYTTLMPCHECARSIIQAGIKVVVYLDDANERFVESSEYARTMFKEAGVELIEFEESVDDMVHCVNNMLRELRFMGAIPEIKKESEIKL